MTTGVAVVVAVSLAACGGGGDGGVGRDGDAASPTSAAPTPSTGAPPPETTTAPPPPSPAPPSPAPRPLTGRTVVLDPGHNGRNAAHLDEINRVVDIGTGTKACNTTGTATDDGYAEATFTWRVAGLARTALEDLGAAVVLTRADNDGWGPCIDERAAIANRAEADAAISIHGDGGPPGERGFHVIHPAPVAGLTDDIAAASQRLAVALRDAYRRTGIPTASYIGHDGLSARDDLGGLTLSDVPVVFLEAGNLRNATDAALLTSPAFQAEIAEAVAAAVVAFLGG